MENLLEKVIENEHVKSSMGRLAKNCLTEVLTDKDTADLFKIFIFFLLESESVSPITNQTNITA